MNNGRESLKENQHKVTAEIQVLRPGLDGKLIVDPNQQKIVISRSAPSQATARWAARRDAMQEAGWQASLWGAVRIPGLWRIAGAPCYLRSPRRAIGVRMMLESPGRSKSPILRVPWWRAFNCPQA